MKVLLALTLALGLVSGMTVTAQANVCTKIQDVCNGGYCRTVVYYEDGGVWVSDLWKE
jgi:hypothetical protein